MKKSCVSCKKKILNTSSSVRRTKENRLMLISNKHVERLQKFKETDDLNCIYKKALNKACFVHDVAHA